MKPRILILTDPFGKPAFAPRLRYFAEYLVEQGWDVEVYTEQFEPHSFAHTYPIIEFPCFHNKFDWAIKSFWSLLTDWRNRHFSKLVQKAIEGKRFDLVFCTTFSTFPLRAAHDIAALYHLPLHLDIRDVDEQVPNAQYQAHRQWWSILFRNWYKSVNIRRRNQILSKADCITTVSPWHTNFLKQFNHNVHLIYNGFDPELFYYQSCPSDSFLITYIGRIYEFQNTKTIEQAVRELDIPDIQLNWHTPAHCPIDITQVGDEIRKSSILLVLTSPHAKGMMTTKFFEAFGCEKPVLCIPSDNGCLAQTIEQTNAGLASDDIDEIKTFILSQYNEWKRQGYTHQQVREKEQFSRLNESKQLEQLLQNSLNRPLLVDICWTLYHANTTFDFLDYFIHDGKYLRLRHWMKNPVVRLVNMLVLKCFHTDCLRHWCLQYIKSYSEQEIYQMASRFVSQQLKDRKIAASWQLIQQRDIIIVSGTIDPIAQAVAKLIGAKQVFSNDIYKQDIRKHFTNYDILTDNKSDLALVQHAKHAYIVTYNNQSWWMKQKKMPSCTYIEQNEQRY